MDRKDKKGKGKGKRANTNINFGAMVDIKVKDPVVAGDVVDPAGEKSRKLSKAQLAELKRIKGEMRSSKNGESRTVGGHNRPQAPHPKSRPKVKTEAKGGSAESKGGGKAAGKQKSGAKSGKGKGRKK